MKEFRCLYCFHLGLSCVIKLSGMFSPLGKCVCITPDEQRGAEVLHPVARALALWGTAKPVPVVAPPSDISLTNDHSF